MLACCCCDRSDTDTDENVERRSGPTFGTILDIPAVYDISRCGPENEVHVMTVDVPSPFKTSIRVEGTLEPSRYMSFEFSGIHDSHYIGINQIIFRDENGDEIPYTNIQVDGKDVDNDSVKPAFPPNGWWAVLDGDHSLVFDFDEVVHVKEVYFWCANAASTPRKLMISDSRFIASAIDTSNDYCAENFFQLSGVPGKDPSSVTFKDGKTCEEVIEFLNSTRPENKFNSFISSDGRTHFVFYEKGSRTSTYNYFFGLKPENDVNLANNIHEDDGVEIPEVEYRAMSLNELRIVRAIIMSKCINDGWTSTNDGRQLRPEDVTLYDLNAALILPSTERRQCAFKELFPSGKSSPTVYVSHWWGEPVLDFIRCCEYHARGYGLSPDEATYWVCAYANRQHNLATDLGVDPSKSSFNRAMALASRVLLVCDMEVVAISRIWVDFELYRTVAMDSGLDVVIHANGAPHLIAAEALPGESPYQKNRREQLFPFKHVCRKILEVELHTGKSSMLVDKVRILNTMIGFHLLDDYAVLKRAEKQDLANDMYRKDLELYALSNNAIKAELACKAISIALSEEGQSCDNFWGFNLLNIISMDTLRKTILLNDIVSLDSVTDDILVSLVKLSNAKTVERFEINAKGCRNITDMVLGKLNFSSNLLHLLLNLGYARNLTNEALVKFTSKIPSSLHTLDIDFSGYKNPEGSYLPPRYADLLEALAGCIPPGLSSLKLCTTLHDEDGGLEGLLHLIRSLPVGMKTICFTFEQWDNFKSGMITAIGKSLPATLEEFSLLFYNGDHIEDDDMCAFAAEVAKLPNLKKFTLLARSHGRYGYYKTRDITTVEKIREMGETGVLA